MSEDWESEDLKPPPIVKASDKWDGEDEEDIKDNWDDEDEEDKSDKSQSGTPTAQPKRKRTLQQIIAEKEEKKRLEAEERRKRMEEELKNMTPEEQNAEKLRRQKMQEEADLRTAMETFGIKTSGSIDSITPVIREDYDNLRKLLVAKLTPNEKSPLYTAFLEDLLRDLTANLDTDDIKKLSSNLATLANEKIKLAKGAKTKKKKGASLKVERGEMDNFGDDFGAEYDDFM